MVFYVSYLNILSTATRILESYGKYPDTNDQGYIIARRIHDDAFAELLRTGMPYTRRGNMVIIEAEGEEYGYQIEDGAAEENTEQPAQEAESVQYYETNSSRETYDAPGEIDEEDMEDDESAEDSVHIDYRPSDDVEDRENGTSEEPGEPEADSEEGEPEEPEAFNEIGDESILSGLEETGEDPAAEDQRNLYREEEYSGLEGPSDDNPAKPDTLPEAIETEEDAGQIAQNDRKAFDTLYAPEFTMSKLVVTIKDEKQNNMICILCMPLTIDREKPRILAVIIKGDTATTHLSKKNDNRINLNVYSYPLIITGEIKDGKYHTRCTLPSQYSGAGVHLEQTEKTYGNKGHTVVENDERTFRLHILPIGFGNAEETGRGTFAYYIESENGERIGSTADTEGMIRFVDDGTLYEAYGRWDISQRLRFSVRPVES